MKFNSLLFSCKLTKKVVLFVMKKKKMFYHHSLNFNFCILHFPIIGRIIMSTGYSFFGEITDVLTRQPGLRFSKGWWTKH